MIRIFIGYDPVETIAWHVLAHSIIEKASEPVCFTPIGNTVLGKKWKRRRGEYDSTEFSNARFQVASLCDYKGWAIFMDCDMICEADIATLWEQRDYNKAVLVRKHSHRAQAGVTKFLGQQQTEYSRKNWSSLMLINCEHDAWRSLNAEIKPGLAMHRFEFLDEHEIGEIQGSWNHLLEPGNSGSGLVHKLSHFTLGGPWHGWTRYPASWAWCNALARMLGGDNPRAHINVVTDQRGVTLGGSYRISSTDAKAEKNSVK